MMDIEMNLKIKKEMAKIILINKQEYEVSSEEAVNAYYALKRKEYKCIIKNNLAMSCDNIRRIEFDCTQDEGQADCLHCGNNGIYENYYGSSEKYQRS